MIKNVIFVAVLIFMMFNCGERPNVSSIEKKEPVGLTKDSLMDLSGLSKMIAHSIHPIMFGCDTLLLNNIGSHNSPRASDPELNLIYFPFEEDSAEFSKAFKQTGKKILYSSAKPELEEERAVMVDIEGRILSSQKILIVENYNKYPCSGHIEKLFTFSNGKWTYFIKDSSWMSPVFVEDSSRSNGKMPH
jgi:hypothetical protein